MGTTKILAVALVAAGVLGLIYGGFRYTRESHDAKFGPLELSFKEKRTVNIPAWAGIGAVVAGAILLLVRTRH
jgi:uncharacterized membrane protein YidH (DUF202 family)